MTTPAQRIAKWRVKIIASWQKQVAAIVATGKLLKEAHDDLIDVHGAWTNLVENELPFDRSMAYKLMAIAANPVLSNVSNLRRLPASVTALYDLHQIEPETLSRLLDEGQVNSRTGVRDAARIHREADESERSEAVRITTALRRAITRFHTEISDLLSGTLPDDQLELVLTTIREQSERMNELRIDIERRISIQRGATLRPTDEVLH
jgi:hypothetical protein